MTAPFHPRLPCAVVVVVVLVDIVLFLFYFSVQYVGLLLESDHNRISWDVVCDMYARPFMEMVCPGQR